MNEHPYKVEHLREYTGILTSECSGGTFKMELKLEDNPVLERSVEKIESSIELEFYYNYGLSTLFFHDIHSCPSRYSQDESCTECDKMREIYDKFEANIYFLQIGDTFKIKAALINNDQSELPAEIHNFEKRQPLTVACTEQRLRLDDTPEGINKKYELEQQRLQREREEEERRKEEEERRKEEEERQKEKEEREKRNEKWDRIEQWLDKRKNIQKFVFGYLVGVLPPLIALLLMIYKSCSTP